MFRARLWHHCANLVMQKDLVCTRWVFTHIVLHCWSLYKTSFSFWMKPTRPSSWLPLKTGLAFLIYIFGLVWKSKSGPANSLFPKPQICWVCILVWVSFPFLFLTTQFCFPSASSMTHLVMSYFPSPHNKLSFIKRCDFYRSLLTFSKSNLCTSLGLTYCI